VDDGPGTTRDRIQADGDWNGVIFTVVDTGGIEVLPERTITEIEARLAKKEKAVELLSQNSALFIREIRAQAELAIEEADAVIMLCDAETGPTAADTEVAEILRRAGKPVLLAVNKADNAARRDAALEFYALGLGEPHAISALHGTGVGDLLDELVAVLPNTPEEEEGQIDQIAIVKRLM
jgi:GTP-binding protein